MSPRTPTSVCRPTRIVFSAIVGLRERQHPAGTRDWRSHTSGFRRASAALTACAVFLLSAACHRGGGSASARNLESAGAIWQLSPSEARRGYLVSIHGTVTYFDTRLGILTVQDSTAGIAVDTSGVLTALPPGQRVDIQGFTGYEANAPIIGSPTIRAVAETRPASPKRVAEESLWDGKADYQWVEVTARLVERLSLDSEHTRFRLSLDGREAECTVATAESPGLTSLVGEDVLIRAVPIASRSTSGSIVGLQLYVPPRGNVIAVRPRPAASTPLTTQ